MWFPYKAKHRNFQQRESYFNLALNTRTVLAVVPPQGCEAILKAKKTHGFKSCIVISVYILDILSIEKATEYRND